MNLFGRKKTEPSVTPTAAIQKLKQAELDSQKREAFLERQRDEAREEGRKKLKAGDRNGAVFYLRRMKMIEKELSSLYGKRANLDTLVRTLEAATFDKSLIQAMTAGHHATKQLVRDDEVDRVQDMIADLQEDMSRVEEIGNALAEPISNEAIDEEELLREFEEKEENVVTADVTADVSELDVAGLPSVPTTRLPASTVAAAASPAPVTAAAAAAASSSQTQVDDFKQLEALMNL